MTHSTSCLADFIMGITASALHAEDEERIERHSTQQQSLDSGLQSASRCRSDPAPFMDKDEACLPQVA